MEDALITILETTKYPVYRQGSREKEEVYPETFITFWNDDTPDHAHYDNADFGTEWFFDVYVYSTDPAKTYSVLNEIRTALKAAGWIVPSKGYDVASDEATHTCRGMEVQYLEVPQN